MQLLNLKHKSLVVIGGTTGLGLRSTDEFEAECHRLGQKCRTLRNGEGTDL